MVANLRDMRNSWILGPDGAYRQPPGAAQGFSAHAFFMTNPSLSGRGSAQRRQPRRARDKAPGE
jgi:polyphosphate kinase